MAITPSILILLALSVSNMPDEPVEEESISDLTLDPSGEISEYEMNETFTDDTFEYTFTDVYYAEVDEKVDEDTIDLFGVPDNLLVIEFEYTNLESSSLAPYNKISFYGDNFIIVDYDPTIYIPEVDPGETGKYRLLYDVPEDVESLEIDINTFNDDHSVDTAIVKIVVKE